MNGPRIVALVQARMTSQRLPGKVLASLPGRERSDLTVLDWVVLRARLANTVDEVVVATSEDPADDDLATFCNSRGYPCFRGSLNDVLDRMTAAAEAYGADTVVRITADCPLIDPAVIDDVVTRHLRGGHDFTANRLPPPYHRTYPIGLDVEVAQQEALSVAAQEATSRAHREHVMPFLYEDPGRFDIHVVEADVDGGAARWTVDTPEDLEAVRQLVALGQVGLATPWRALLATWESHPDLCRINAAIEQRTATETDPRLA